MNICPTCVHYLPVGQQNPIAPACMWRPTPEQLAELRAILPAPHMSLAMVRPTPLDVAECGQFGGGNEAN